MSALAIFKCSTCGYQTDTRCKPKTCPKCQGKDTFAKQA